MSPIALAKRYWPYLIGLALYCIMLRQPYSGSLLPSDLAGAHSLRILLDGLLACCGVLLIVAGRFSRIHLDTVRLCMASGLLFAASIAISAMTKTFHLFSEAWIAASVILLALALSVLTLIWVQVMRRIEDDELGPILMLSFVLSMVAGPFDYLKGPVRDFVNIVIPLASIACAVCGLRRAQPRENHAPSTNSHSIAVPIAVLICVEILSCSFLRGAGSGGGIGLGDFNVARISAYLASAVVGILFYVIAVRNKPYVRAALHASVVSLACVMVLIVLFILPRIIPISPIFTSLHSALLFVLLGLFIAMATADDAVSDIPAGCFMLVFGLDSIISFTVIPALYSYDRAQSAQLVLPIALIAALTISAGVFGVNIIRFRQQAKQIASAEPGRADANPSMWDVLTAPVPAATTPPPTEEERMAQLADKAATRYGLTAREAEIVVLFGQGYSIKRTAELLYLAPSTVHSYTKSIYAKLGIHKKEEIRDLLLQL